VEPNRALRAFHDRKYRVFQAMYQHQLEYRAAMSEGSIAGTVLTPA
jgi:hypothetical protein